MLAQVLSVLSRLLVFRAGPQDFPFAPQVTRGALAAAVAALTLMWGVAARLPVALGLALVTAAAIALVSRMLLRARRLDNRFQQTLAALLCVTAVHALLLAPLLAQIAPELMRAMQDPVLAEKMRAGEPVTLAVSAWASVLSDLVVVWNVAVTTWILRHALDLRLLPAVLLTLFYGASVFFFVVFLGALVVALLAGAPAAQPGAGG